MTDRKEYFKQYYAKNKGQLWLDCKDGATMMNLDKKDIVDAILLALVVISMANLFYLPEVDREVECRDGVGNRIVGSNCIQTNPEPISLIINLVAVAIFLISFLRRLV